MTTTTTINGGTLTVTPNTEPYNEQQNYGAFAVIKSDGSVFAWGDKNSGGDISSVASQLDGTIPVTQIFTNSVAFAALRSDGSVVTWGSANSGGDSSTVSSQLNGDIDVTQIYSNYGAFAALRSDGSVVSWGTGSFDSAFANQLNGFVPVTKIFSEGNWGSFAALRSNGSVITDAKISDFSSPNSFDVSNQLDGQNPVKDIYSNGSAYAAIRQDGSVVTWGAATEGGDSNAYHYDRNMMSSSSSLVKDYSVSNQLNGITKVVQIFSTYGAFAALLENDTVVTWGMGIDRNQKLLTQLDGTKKVKQIYSTESAFAALREDGSVVTWLAGHSADGSITEAKGWDSISPELNGDIPITKIYSSNSFFAALRTDDKVITWGDSWQTGKYISTYQLNGKVKEIVVADAGFAALLEDGSVVSWGSGGQDPKTGESIPIDTSAVANKLNGKIDVVKIYSNYSGFAALRADGSVVTWGQNNYSSAVANDLNGDIDVKEIYSNGNGFAALRADGSVVTWAQGVDSKVVADLTDVVSFANPATDDVYVAPAKEAHINHQPTGNITIAGAPTQSHILSVKNTLTDADGLGDFNYQWLSNGSEIFGATDASYLLSAADIGKKISVKVNYLDGEGTEEFVISNATTAVISNISTKATIGNDQITGTTKAEKIDGLAGSDLLSGLAGNDTLIGGAGLDSLIGGAGADNLTGGIDSDIFKFTALADSGITSKNRDIITDFTSKIDKIDLSAIDANEKSTGDQTFTFIGNAAFNKTNAAGQLRFDATSKILYGSTDADTAPEFSIQLNGVSSLVATDFVL